MKAKNISKDNCKFMQLVKQFYSDQQGVYMIMTGLLSFILLGVIALAVDGSGILLDKARLQHATEQAALALVAENNNYRVNKDHSDVTRQNVSADEIKLANNDVGAAKREKRNQEIIQGFVKNYLRTPYDNTDNRIDSSAAVTLEKPEKGFEYECYPIEVKNSKGGIEKMATCGVTAVVMRKTWLHLTDDKLTFDKREKIDSGLTYAVKRRDKPVPVDLMLVADFSGSMYEKVVDGKYIDAKDRTKGNRDPRVKVQILREVVDVVAQELIPDKEKANLSPYNRIGVVAYGFGAQQGSTRYCNLPFIAEAQPRVVYIRDKEREKGNETNAWKTLRYGGKVSRSQYTEVIHKDGKHAIRIAASTDKIVNALLYNEVTSFTGGSGQTRNEIYKLKQEYEPGRDAWDDWPLSFIAMSYYFKWPETVDSIDTFDGKFKKYGVEFPKNGHCLGSGEIDKGDGDPNTPSTHIWFVKSQAADLHNFLYKLKPEGNTLSSSGMLIGANLLMNKQTNPLAQPDKLEANTQRILMVLSDGKDTILPEVTERLQKLGMCERIRKRLDTLQDDKFKKMPSKIAFVLFGNPKAADQFPADKKDLWVKCVGAENFYEAKDKDELIKSFKKIIAVEEEVGTISNKKPQ